jgi:small subunit ribosomal protein S8e
MATRKGKKITGGKYVARRKKKAHEIAGQKRTIKLGEDKRKSLRVRGGARKTVILTAKAVNILDKKTKKSKKAEIKNVVETPSNRFLARQNVLTKGTIVETSLGKARITNRPTQEGVVNGVLVE